MKVALLIFLIPISALATPQAIEDILNEIGGKNVEVQTAQLNTRFKEQSLVGAKSRLWPQLSLSATANTSDDGAAPADSTLTSGSSGGSGLSALSSTSDYGDVTDGWIAQATLGYFVFSKFGITEDIRRAKNDLKSSELSQSVTFDSKRAQFLQLLLQWQLLREVLSPIEKARSVVKEVEDFSKSKSGMLYTASDRANLRRRKASVEYDHTRVTEGLDFVFSALKTLHPQLTETRLTALPKISVSYPIPPSTELESLYRQSSRSYMTSTLDIESARGFKRSTDWDRAFIPTVYVSTSYSNSNNYDNTAEQQGTSASIVMNFSVFDGFYSKARREQARVALEMAKNKRHIEKDKLVLLLKHKRMDALVAKAEYEVKASKANKKKLRYQDLERKEKLGFATKLDLSVGVLQWVSSQMDALDTLKKYQQNMLDIAVELNDFAKVEINETP